MITCLCPGDDREADLDAALEVPWVTPPWADHEQAPPCLKSGPHHHLCTRRVGHTGRHAEHLIPEVGLRLVLAVWDD